MCPRAHRWRTADTALSQISRRYQINEDGVYRIGGRARAPRAPAISLRANALVTRLRKLDYATVRYLDTVVAGGDPSVLHLDVSWWMGELALRVGPGALVALELPANLQLQPPRVLAVQ